MKRLIPLIMLVVMACQPKTEEPIITRTAEELATQASRYETYTIEYLRERSYGGGTLEVVETLAKAEEFTQYLIRYPSDGLMIYGFADVPQGTGPYPVIIAIHGYVAEDTYVNSGYGTDTFDLIARNGFIVIHPFLRNYAPSDKGDNLFRVGMSVDVLNLIALMKSGSGPGELFSTAAQDQIGLWGYSIGGGIALRVLTVSADVKAAVLYASTSGDEGKNMQRLSEISSDPGLETEKLVPSSQLEKISPMNFYHFISAPVQLFHGTADSVIPVSWAEETCSALKASSVEVSCKYFTDEEHSFRRRVAEEFYAIMFGFYNKYLLP